ncbi:hypothetical protein CRE_03491 [Caenorhabditis remanei]|uniref:DNA-directed DNA polymerase n=1 Tax=Caenorhabditis remanei TaxID=31234 RepID=E3NJD7_CAERE|nr:hypothetical protein CRE_03491 [Caenorhabditis remanei]
MSDSFDEFPLGATNLTHAEAMALCQNPGDCSFDEFPQNATRLSRVDALALCTPQNASTDDFGPPSKRMKITGPSDIGTPLMTSTPIKNSESTLRKLPNQYGAGRPRKETDNPFTYISPNHFPTPKELRFFTKSVRMSKENKLTRKNAAFYALDTIRIKFNALDDIKNPALLHKHVAKCIDIFIRKQIHAAGGDLETTPYWLQMQHEGFREEAGFFISHKTHSAVGGGEIINTLARQMQSNKNLGLDGSFSVAMNVFKDGARRKLMGRGVEKKKGTRSAEKMKETILQHHFGEKRKRVLGDSHCMVKALCLGKLVSDSSNPRFSDVERKKFKKTLYNMTRMDRTLEFQTNAQLKMAKNFLEEAQMDTDQEEHGREDLEVLAAYLEDYQITLWSIKGRDTVLTEEAHYNEKGKGFIGLFHYKGHYEYVTHTKSGKPSRFCYKCSTWAAKHHSEKCKAKCWWCGFTECKPEPAIKIHCDDCNIDFPGQDCFDRHLKCVTGHALPNCKKFFFCSKCMKYDRTPEFQKRSHVCGATHFCAVCKAKKEKEHECSHPMPTEAGKKKKREKQEKWTIIVYDAECVVVKSGEYSDDPCRGPKHMPNMIVAHMFCNECRGKAGCPNCKEPIIFSYKDDEEEEEDDDHHFAGEEEEEDSEVGSDSECDFDESEPEERSKTLTKFSKFLMTDPRANGAYVIAHNGGRYDHVMVMAEMDRLAGPEATPPSFIMNGKTFISAEFSYKKQRIHFRDSLQYLQMGLAKMPSAFGLTGEAKGYFPYLYNHPDNYDKVLTTLPPKEYYSPDFMGASKKEEFEEWYEENYNTPFDLYTEMERYCLSDVRILRLTLVAFIEVSDFF